MQVDRLVEQGCDRLPARLRIVADPVERGDGPLAEPIDEGAGIVAGGDDWPGTATARIRISDQAS